MAIPQQEAVVSEAVGLRVHRSRSWLRKARKADDLDSQFVFLWIAFNALYGRPRYLPEVWTDEARDLRTFIGKLEEASRAQLRNTLAAHRPRRPRGAGAQQP